MLENPDYLALSDAALLAQCEVNVTRASGPGGQHRNKVSTAVRLRHRPTGVSAGGEEWRSQQENRRQALARLRMKIACEVRRPVDPAAVPEVVRACLFVPRGHRDPSGPAAGHRLQVGRKDQRYCPVAAFLLDLLEAHLGRLAEAAAVLDISTSNLVSVLKDDRHLFVAAAVIRQRHGQGPLK